MKLSASIKKNIIKTVVGGVTNVSSGTSRRYTLFFEDILAFYVKECENKGYPFYDLDKDWMKLVMSKHFSGVISKLPLEIFLNDFMSEMWSGLGLMDEFNFSRNGDEISIKTRNEGVTRIIGPNNGMLGFYAGILEVLYNSGAQPLSSQQSRNQCTYLYKLKGETKLLESKTKEQYNKLNKIPENRGFNLKQALKRDIFTLTENNKIFFRGKFLCPIENTIFHLIGQKKIMLEGIPEISFNYFNGLVDNDSSLEDKLRLLKTLLQVMGWGLLSISLDNDGVVVNIYYPPYGMQKEQDNWLFLSKTIQGFLWLHDRSYAVKEVISDKNRVSFTYVLNG